MQLANDFLGGIAALEVRVAYVPTTRQLYAATIQEVQSEFSLPQ